ncbi:MAG TPA: ADOP family duplicated permease [Vicinamibacterales bacterium]|nr:ADOP family duplicated permease [Vicinamibacterales bacterium]
MRPPRLARACLRRLLPASHRDLVLQDLDDEFARHIAPSRSRLGARWWYWRQAVGSWPHAFRLRHPRVAVADSRPAHRRQHLRAVVADARFAWRLYLGRPALTAAATATLAVGIAVTTAALSVVHAVLLRPLPYEEPGALVHVGEVNTDDTRGIHGPAGGNLSWPDFTDYRRAQRALVDLVGYSGGSRTLTTSAGTPDRVPMAEVTAGFFDLLGVRPQTGRLFTSDDNEPGAPPVVLLSDGAWRRRFGGDPAIVGGTIGVNGRPATVIGVLPASFAFPLRGQAELWLPIRPSSSQLERRYFHWLNVIGRLRPDVPIEAARADLDRIAAGFAAIDPTYHAATASAVLPLTDVIVGDVRPVLLLVLGAAALVLVVACANVAGLVVAERAARARELAVRGALGATRGRLVTQMLVESLVLSAPGLLLGLGAGAGLVSLVVASLPAARRAALPHLDSVTLHPVVVATIVVVSVGAALLVGLVPALRRPATGLATGLRVAGASRRGAQLSPSLVAAQVALSVVLLASAGVVGQSVWRLLAVSPGFEVDGLFTARANLGGARYATPEARLEFHRSLTTRLAALTGVSGVATISQLPLTGAGNSGTFLVESVPDAPERSTRIRSVSTNYFEVMGVPVLAGRGFSDRDVAGSPRVLVVNETFARMFFDGRPLDQRVAFPFFTDRPFWQIVGVVGDEQLRDLDMAPLPIAYFAYPQTPDGEFGLVVRTPGDPAALTGPARAVLAELDPALPLFSPQTLDEILSASLGVLRRRVVLTLLALFAVAAIVVSIVGLQGLVAQTVSERTREIAVRVSLGARPAQVVGSVLRRGLAPAAVGAVAGLALYLLVARALSGLVFDVSPVDPATLAAVVVVMVGVAALACVAPARRAATISPTEAIKGE